MRGSVFRVFATLRLFDTRPAAPSDVYACTSLRICRSVIPRTTERLLVASNACPGPSGQPPAAISLAAAHRDRSFGVVHSPRLARQNTGTHNLIADKVYYVKLALRGVLLRIARYRILSQKRLKGCQIRSARPLTFPRGTKGLGRLASSLM